jgi:hypothetical protein
LYIAFIMLRYIPFISSFLRTGPTFKHNYNVMEIDILKTNKNCM